MVMTTAQELMLEGEVKGKIQGKKDIILDILNNRFGKVPKEISGTVNSYCDSTALMSLAVLAGTCKSLKEFKDGLR